MIFGISKFVLKLQDSNCLREFNLPWVGQEFKLSQKHHHHSASGPEEIPRNLFALKVDSHTQHQYLRTQGIIHPPSLHLSETTKA